MTARIPESLFLVIDHLWPDGAQRQFVGLAKGLKRAEIPLQVCSLVSGGPLAGELERMGIPVLDLNKKNRRDYFRLVPRLCGILKDTRPQVVHGFLFYSNNLARIAGKSAGIPIVVTSQRCSPYKKFIPLYARTMQEIILGLSDITVINSPPPALARKRSPYVYVPNGIDLEPFANLHPSPEIRKVDRVPVLLSVGRLEAQKGHTVLIDAVAMLKEKELPRVFLYVAGQGSLRRSLEKRVKKKGICDCVRFLGFCDDMRPLYASADVVVNASLFEGMPNAVMEAMACQRPIVATKVGGTTELIRDGKEGLLVPAGDVFALAHKIAWLCEHKEEASLMARSARLRIENEFTMDLMVGRHLELYGRLLEQKGL